MIVIRAIAAVALLSEAAVAEQAQPPQPASPAPITVTGERAAGEEKPICKYTDTGSLIRRKVCMTKEQWAKAEADSKDGIQAMRDWQRVRCNMGTVC